MSAGGRRGRAAFVALAGLVLLADALPAPAAGEDCRGGLCVDPRCSSSNPVEVWVRLSADQVDAPSSPNRPIHRSEVTGYNVRSWCFDEQKEIGLQAGALRVPNGCSFSVQACVKGETTLLIRSPSRCSAWSDFQVSCPAPPAPPQPSGTCGPATYGTPGCPYPSLGGSKAQADFVDFCEDYAAKAVTAVAEAKKLECGKTGARWSSDYGMHATWCINLNGDRTLPDGETAARASELQACSGKLVHIAKPLSGAAALLARKDFTGRWDTVTGGAHYTMILSQTGGQVTGTYQPRDGTIASATIANTQDGRTVITFAWTEGTGASGTGRFVLAAGGNSFTGSWSATADPNAVSATWSGTRLTDGEEGSAGTVAPPGAVKLKPLKQMQLLSPKPKSP